MRENRGGRKTPFPCSQRPAAPPFPLVFPIFSPPPHRSSSPAANRSLLSQPDFSPETGAISTQPLPLSVAHHLLHRSSPFPFFPQLLHQDKPILFIISFGAVSSSSTKRSGSLRCLLLLRSPSTPAPQGHNSRAVPHLLRPTAPASTSGSFLPQPPNSLQRQQPTQQRPQIHHPPAAPPDLAPEAEEKKKKKHITYRSVGEADFTKRRKKNETDLKKRTNQKCKSVVCAFFVVVADDVAPHRLQGGEKEKKQSQANPFSGDSRTARGLTRRQMRWRVEDAPPLFSRPEILLNTVPACRRCSL